MGRSQCCVNSCAMRVLLALLGLGLLGAPGARCLTRDDFYTYGRGLDAQLIPGDDVSSEEIELKVPIRFFGEDYPSIYVNTNGLLSFITDIKHFINMEFPLGYPVLAPFYANVDTTKSGTVYYREAHDAYMLAKAEEDLRLCFPYIDNADRGRDYNFRPTSLFIATWSDVGYHKGGTDRTNTFQAVIISNGTESYAVFLYPEDGIQWIQANPQASGLSDVRAQIGITSVDGSGTVMKSSGKEMVKMVAFSTNCDTPGKYMYRIGNVRRAVEEPQVFENSVLENQSQLTCATGGAKLCHHRARCEDRAQGFCCVCNEDYYGNGKHCLKKDAPIRVNGQISSEINGEHVEEIDLQAYVVMSDGRTYTALSNVPDRIGFAMQTMSSLGGVIGWLFAKPIGKAKNGYQITGGIFNNTINIMFTNTNEVVTITQRYLGLDLFDQLKMKAEIRGSLPRVPPQMKLEISDYAEQYTTQPGKIRSESQRTYRIKGLYTEYPCVITQTISYHSCPYLPREDAYLEPMTLKVSKNFLEYESKEGIIRYGMSNRILPLGQEDPCIEGRKTCGPHSSCAAEEDSYRCVCHNGYELLDARSERAICIDINECSLGSHSCDEHATCINREGSYDCRCNPNYEGDGRECSLISPCQNYRCPPYTTCYEEAGKAYCKPDEPEYSEVSPPPSSTGCDELNDCSPYAICIQPDPNGDFVCECQQGYVGDGYTCSEVESTSPEYLEPVPSVEENYRESVIDATCTFSECWCPREYYLEGKYCYLKEGTTDLPIIDEKDCSTLKCHPYAQCVVDAYWGKSECKCTAGFEGDGIICNPVEASCENENICDPNASCEFDPGTATHICICDAGFQGNGHVCTSNDCFSNEDCKPNAECKYSRNIALSRRICECKVGYVIDYNNDCVPIEENCNGARCADHATCTWDQQLEIHYCTCDDGYTGDGVQGCVAGELPEDDCTYLDLCDVNAACIFNVNQSKHVCECLPGFEGDGNYCTFQHSCEHNPYMCSSQASCVQREEGYVCECNSGYVGNGTICKRVVKHEGNFLLLNQGVATLRIPFNPSPNDLPRPIQLIHYQMAVGLDVDCQEGRVYWSDITGRTIKSSNYDGSMFEVLFTQDIISPEGISIDWVSRNIFWTDSRKDTIEVANLNTKVRKVLFNTKLVDPRGIAAHPYKGKLFWSDWNRKNPKIEWSNMDGTDREIFLDSTMVALPNSLAIDWDTDELCFADAGKKTIECIQIDTRDRRTIATNCSYPFGITISPTHYYWTDWATQKVESVEKETNTRLPSIDPPLGGSDKKLYEIAAVSGECKQMFNSCQIQNGKCPDTHLCLLDGKGGRTCVCGKPPNGPSSCNN